MRRTSEAGLLAGPFLSLGKELYLRHGIFHENRYFRPGLANRLHRESRLYRLLLCRQYFETICGEKIPCAFKSLRDHLQSAFDCSHAEEHRGCENLRGRRCFPRCPGSVMALLGRARLALGADPRRLRREPERCCSLCKNIPAKLRCCFCYAGHCVCLFLEADRGGGLELPPAGSGPLYSGTYFCGTCGCCAARHRR